MCATSQTSGWFIVQRMIFCYSVLWIVSTTGRAEAPLQRSNVLFIAVDDLNTALSIYGHAIVKTPNLDRLAQRGVVFDRAYCQTPWCNPSRASLLSGLRPQTTRILDLETPVRTHIPDAVLLPELFKKNGYFTARVGKIYHESGPTIVGTEDDPPSWSLSEKGFRGMRKTKEVFRKHVDTRGSSKGLEWAAYDVADDQTTDGYVARRIATLMEQRGKNEQPWFLACGFRKPHLLWDVPKKYFDLYDAKTISLPQEPPLEQQGIPEGGRGWNAKDPKLSDADWREALAAYYAGCSYVDAQLGVLLDALDKNKAWDDTIVVLWGDHGYMLGEHGGNWEKVRLWEESIRAPLVIAAPGFKPAHSSRIVEFVDIYPTLQELCRLPAPPQKLEGASLVPLLKQADAAWDRPAYSDIGRADKPRGRSVRTEKWHYFEFGGGENPAARALYDPATDPHEYKNLAQDPKHADTVAEMRKLLAKVPWKKP